MDQCGPSHGILLDTGDETVGGSNHSFMSAVVDGLFTVSEMALLIFSPLSKSYTLQNTRVDRH
jgi:hypothetical protein